MDYATDDNEYSHAHDIDGVNDNSTEDLNDNCNVQESIDINKVITSFNLAIEWSESVNLPVQDILYLKSLIEIHIYCSYLPFN